MHGAGLEWLWRLAMEPTKLWRRDFVDGPRFIYHALAETLMLRLESRYGEYGSSTPAASESLEMVSPERQASGQR
jgi:hypothetical protein